MPVRAKAIHALTEALVGGVAYNSITGVIYLGGRGVKLAERVTADRYEVEDQVAVVYEALVDSIDWNRVMLEAQTRHIALNHGSTGHGVDEPPCGECIAEALIQRKPWADWVAEPKAEREAK